MGAFFVRNSLFLVHTIKSTNGRGNNQHSTVGDTTQKQAVLTLLNDEEWSEWSDREIARKCEVSNPFVSKMRKSLLTINSDNEIAKHAEVSQPFVSKLRKTTYNDYKSNDRKEVESSYKDYKIESSRKVKRGDQEYTVDTNQYSYE